MNRRQFLTVAGSAALLHGSGVSHAFAQQRGSHVAAPPSHVDPFTFIFFTDTHLEPELNAAKGCSVAFRSMRNVPGADFAIQGGDHCFDTLAVPKARSLALWELYDKTQQDLSVKVYHTVGNHDVMGLKTASGTSPDDPLYGKKFFRDHLGPTYYSFDRKGVHFIVLDSVQMTPDRDYEGRIDAEQIAWLRSDLAALPANKPVIVVTHIPLVTAFTSYEAFDPTPRPHHQLTVVNSNEVLPIFAGHNVLAVLQGHTHINERVEWHGIPYITGGAVCGNWWKGTRLGTPEGYTIVSVDGGSVRTRYVPYGFKAVAPQQNT